MNPTIERVVAEHIERVEYEMRTARSDVDSLRSFVHEKDSGLFKKAAELAEASRESARLQKLVDDIRAALKTTAKGHDLVRVADTMRRDLEERSDLVGPEPKPTSGGAA
jgi:peptidoglycan hydrolase CwlO-like protein